MGTTALASALSQSSSYNTIDPWSNYKNPMLVAFGEQEVKDIASNISKNMDIVSIEMDKGKEHTQTFFQQSLFTLSSLENITNTFDVWNDGVKFFATQSALIGPAPGYDVDLFYPNKRGSGSNAIRHVTLTSLGTAMYGEEYMRGLMNSHEIGSTEINHMKVTYSELLLGDKAVDLRNNEIGYRLGKTITATNGSYKLNSLHAVIDEFHNNGLWRMKKVENKYYIYKTKMDDNIYSAFKEALKYKDSNLVWIDKEKARRELIKNKEYVVK